MAATSKHYGDVELWIEKVIKSCETPLQEITARHLIQNFEKNYFDIPGVTYSTCTRRLRNLLDLQKSTRLSNLIKIEERKIYVEQFT